MTFCDMKMLYWQTKCVFDRKLSFPMHLFLIENLHFHFICNYDRIYNPRKRCDRSIFSLHMKHENRVVTEKTPITAHIVNRHISYPQMRFKKHYINLFLLQDSSIWNSLYEVKKSTYHTFFADYISCHNYI